MKCLITFLTLLITSVQLQTSTLTTLSPPKYELTKSHIVEFIHQLPQLQHPDILYQKIMLETGHLKSERATSDGNLIGMKTVKQRPTTQSGTSTNGYGKYYDWRDSIVDYLLWQQHVVKKKMTKEQYYNFTAKIYSVNREKYVRVLKQIKVPQQL